MLEFFQIKNQNFIQIKDNEQNVETKESLFFFFFYYARFLMLINNDVNVAFDLTQKFSSMTYWIE